MSLPTEISIQGTQAWQELARQHFLTLDCQAAQPLAFQCRAMVARFGDSLAAEMSVSASRVLRRRRDAERTEGAFFKIFWQIAGHSCIEQGPHQARLEPGMWSIYDTTREYTIESSNRSRFMVLLVPQADGQAWSPAVGALGGKALDGGGAPRIVMSALAGMLRDGSTLDPESQRTLQDSTVALVERALEVQVRHHRVTLSADQATRLERVKAYILERLADPRLTPETVAQAFGLSRRTLYNLFLVGNGTPRAFIQDARLAQACRLLQHPAWRERPVAHVALHCGFADAAHFSRAFHARHGMPPMAWRDRQTG